MSSRLAKEANSCFVFQNHLAGCRLIWKPRLRGYFELGHHNMVDININPMQRNLFISAAIVSVERNAAAVSEVAQCNVVIASILTWQ